MRQLRVVVAAALVVFWASLAFAEDDAAVAAAKTPKSSGQNVVETDNGGRIRWGFDLAVVRVRSARRADEPSRLRHYEMEVDAVPGAFGFSVFWDPPGQPWRFKKTDFQLVSVGALLLFEKGKVAKQSSLSLGVGVGFLERFIILGFLVDLYRGIPVQGADGAAGSSTAETGLFAWAWGRQGEVTPENVSFVINLGLSQLFSKIGTGQ